MCSSDDMTVSSSKYYQVNMKFGNWNVICQQKTGQETALLKCWLGGKIKHQSSSSSSVFLLFLSVFLRIKK